MPETLSQSLKHSLINSIHLMGFFVGTKCNNGYESIWESWELSQYKLQQNHKIVLSINLDLFFIPITILSQV